MAEVPEIQPQERVQIDSKERLRSELGIHTSIDMPEISRTFEVTRTDLEDLKKSLHMLPNKEQLEKIKVFIHEKSEVISETKDKADAFKKTLAVGGVGAVVSEMTDTIKGGMVDMQNAQGLEILDKWASIFDKIGKIWDKLVLSLAATKGGKMLLDFFGIDIPPAESVVDGAGNQEKKEGIVESMGKLSDEKKKEIDEKLFESVSTDLTKQYGLNLDEKLPDGTTKGEKLRSILRKRAESAYSIFVDEHNVVNINAKNLAELTGSGVGIVYDLIKEGVFGVSNMTFDFVNTAEGTVRYVVRSVSGKELSPGMGGAISLDAISDNMTASEKMFLLAIFYRKGGFVTSMLGEIGFILAQPMRLLNSFDNIGTRSVWIPWLNQKIEKMDQVIAMFTKIAPEKAEDIAALKEMRSAAESSKKAIETIVSYKNGQITYEKAQAELNVLKWTYKPLSWIKAGALEHLGFDAWDKAYMKDLFINRNVNYIETLARSINPENVKMFERIKSYFQFLEIPGDMNRTTMYFNSPKDFSGFMKEIGILASQSPEFVRWIFSHLPIFIVAGTVMNEGMKPDGEVLKSLKYFIPIVGPAIMLSDANVKVDLKNHTVDMENIPEGITWGALLTLDLIIFAKLSLAKWVTWSLEFFAKPVVDTARALGSLVRLSWSVGKVVADGAKLGAEFFARWPLPNMKIAAWVLAGIALLVLAGEAIASDSPEEIKEKLIKKWFFNTDGTPNFIQLKEGFKKMSEDERKQILDLTLALEISPYGIDQYIEGATEYKNGTYIIKTKKEHQTLIEKTLLSTDIYSEFELVDNIHIEVIGS